MGFYNKIFSVTMGTFFIFIILLSSLNNVFAQPDNPFNVAAVGDISCNKNGKQTISSIENNHPNLVLFLGDLAYDNSLECFFDQTQVLENNETGNTVLVTIGNHDIDNGDGNKETEKELMIHYNIPSGGY